MPEDPVIELDEDENQNNHNNIYNDNYHLNRNRNNNNINSSIRNRINLEEIIGFIFLYILGKILIAFLIPMLF